VNASSADPTQVVRSKARRLAGRAKGTDQPPRVAILVVNGFDRSGRWGHFNESEAREYPWIDLCLRQIKRHTRRVRYEVLVWDNTKFKDQRRKLRRNGRVRLLGPGPQGKEIGHAPSLDQLVAAVHPETEFLITLDTDSFPVRSGWIDNLLDRLTDEVLLAGVWRDELLPQKPAYIHPCCLAIRTETLRKLDVTFVSPRGHDVGHMITLAVEEAGGRTSRLYRSNRWNPHFLMGALYGDLIYHQGAGSRAPKFKGEPRDESHEALRTTLRDQAFADVDRLVDVLAGSLPPEALPQLAAASAAATGPAAGADPA
jgi:hypothetical protein